MTGASFHDGDLLTAAEADALAAPFKPTPRAGVCPWTPRTRESYLALELTRPVTDLHTERLGGDGDLIGVRPPPPVSAAESKAWRERERKARIRHVRRVQRALGFAWDLTVVRDLRAAARVEAWALRS